jgi:uncharacterized protein (TIGR02302 family)
MDEHSNTKLKQRVKLQQRAIAFEQVWSALHWPLMVAIIAIAIVFSGLLLVLPAWGKWAVWSAIAVAAIASLKDMLKLALPGTYTAARRLEHDNAVTHRPASSIDDALVKELESNETRALWEEYRQRKQQQSASLKPSLPKSSWRVFDPRALRVPAFLAAVASIVLGPGLSAPQGSGNTNLSSITTAPSLTIDAWLKPPTYTGKPPVLLTSQAMADKFAAGEKLQVPENAVLTLRVNGATAPELSFADLNSANLDEEIKSKTTSTPSGFTAQATLSKPVSIIVKDGSKTLASWPIDLIEDQPPTISFPKEHQSEIGGALTLHWEVKDDYGVKSMKSEMSLADEQADGIGFATDGPFLYEAPKFPVNLKRSNAKSEVGKSTQDLTSHPWAGLNVTLTIAVKDGGANTTESKPLTLALPERVFTRPLAKAIIEQRKRLILDPENATDIATLFRTLLIYPSGILDRSAHHIRLSAIASHLANSADNDDIKTGVDDMWQLAMDVEDGSLSDAKAELQALKKQLEDAIKNGASEEEIAKLMDKMRDAMKRYMDAMRKEAERNKQAGKQPQQNNENSTSVTREDLERMMDMIEQLSKQGKQDQAQALLDQLDRMLQNMQPGQNNQQAGEQGNQLGEMLDQLQEMMRQQQRLMDETQRMQPGQGMQPGEGEGNEQGEQGEGSQGQMGQNGQGSQPGGRGQGSLSDRQGALGDMLDEMMRGLGGNAPEGLGEAGREMRGAQGSLGNEDREGALEQQGNALDQLRKGAGELRRQMQRQGQGQARSRGREGSAGGDDDPLGRPRASRDEDRGPNEDIVPSELAAKRAREILEQLRSRANEQGLTDQERGYIDRLLRGLY